MSFTTHHPDGLWGQKDLQEKQPYLFPKFFLFLYVLGHLNTNLHEDTQNTRINI